MKIRTVNLFGFDIDIYKFGARQFMYPAFNGNAEFEITSKGFRKLRRYLKMVTWARKAMDSLTDPTQSFRLFTN